MASARCGPRRTMAISSVSRRTGTWWHFTSTYCTPGPAGCPSGWWWGRPGPHGPPALLVQTAALTAARRLVVPQGRDGADPGGPAGRVHGGQRGHQGSEERPPQRQPRREQEQRLLKVRLGLLLHDGPG